jgi:hypothetical protein
MIHLPQAVVERIGAKSRHSGAKAGQSGPPDERSPLIVLMCNEPGAGRAGSALSIGAAK